MIISKDLQKQVLLNINKVFPSDYNIFQAVYFLYGKNRALQTAIIHLFVKDIFEIDNNDCFRYNAANIPKEGLINPLYPKILELQDGDSLSYKQINEQLYMRIYLRIPLF